MSATFGPAGNSESFSREHKSSLDAPAWLAGRGLDCYEYQCGKGVHVGEDTCRALGERDIALRTGLHCAPLAHRTAGTIDTGTVRLSVSAFSTREDIFRFLSAMEDLCR